MYPYSLLPGDRLLVKKAAVIDNAITHSATYMGDGRVAHLSPGKGLVVEDMTDFAAGQRPEVIRNGGIAEVLLWDRLEMFKTHQNYRLFTNNCEHLCSFLETGQSESRQLRGGVLGFATGYAVTKYLGNSNIFLSLGLLAVTTTIGLKLGAPKARQSPLG